jgi:UPF0271 protein
MSRIDINCDLGESFGAWTIGDDAAMMPYITSANIACGFHAGDPSVMRRTVAAARDHGVAIGAHPGLPDLAGFGRRRMRITADEAYDLTVYQAGALMGFAGAAGVRLRHVKPHGELYNMAAADAALADAIARAVHDVDPALMLFGLAESALVDAARARGLHAVREGFPDRGYAPDGTLLPRSHPRSLVTDAADAAARAVEMVVDGTVTSAEGTTIRLTVDTLCIHGDGPNAQSIATAIRWALNAASVGVAAPVADR